MQKSRTPYMLLLSMIFLLTYSPSLIAQTSSGQDNSVYLIGILVVLGSIVGVSALVALGSSFIDLEAHRKGIVINDEAVTLLPRNWWRRSNAALPSYVGDTQTIALKKGYNLKLRGRPDKIVDEAQVTRFAVRPIDFRGLSPIPRVTVEVGQEVMAGDVIFYDKKDDRVKYVAPVSGEIIEVRRGAKRAITDIIILADKEIQYRQNNPPSLNADRQEIVDYLLESGGWTLLNQRPYDILPDPTVIPQNIFISTFDTAPLAPDANIAVAQNPIAFQKGLDVLNQLTNGKVFLGLDGNGETAPHDAFVKAQGVEKTYFVGHHPAGNVGVQIHHIAPIKPKQTVWTLGIQEVMTLGELMHTGRFVASRIIAIGGSPVEKPSHINTHLGASIADLIADRITEDNARLIAGDVLSGKQVTTDQFLPYRADQMSAISEGDYYEIFGWLLPTKEKPSLSRTFPGHLFKDHEYEGDTNTHGEKRAFVLTGQYEEVMPMNIYPQYLMKAIMTGDFEQMEGLGIYELSEEDVALCEFACTSKMPLQSILRDGLEMMQEQG